MSRTNKPRDSRVPHECDKRLLEIRNRHIDAWRTVNWSTTLISQYILALCEKKHSENESVVKNKSRRSSKTKQWNHKKTDSLLRQLVSKRTQMAMTCLEEIKVIDHVLVKQLNSCNILVVDGTCEHIQGSLEIKDNRYLNARSYWSEPPSAHNVWSIGGPPNYVKV